MQRRTFVSLSGASLFGAVMASAGPGGAGDAVEAFAAVLAGYSPDAAADRLDALPDLEALSAAVASAKRDYQARRYSYVINGLPGLLARVHRHTAHELLDEAGDAGRRLGADANLRWTAFGPTNVTLHRVNIAVTLGDAGAAIDTARTVNLGQVTVTERKASLLIDTARAFLQYGKHENAYLALRAARDIAPEEVAGRPVVRQLVRDLIASAPPSVQRKAQDFARGLGALR